MSESIRKRGQAQIPEATEVVNSFADHVLMRADEADNYAARIWILDRVRLLIVMVLSPQLLEFLHDIPEFAQLNAEYQALVTNYERFGPAHLIAWWWHLNPELFKPYIDAQLHQMEDSLVEATQGIASSGGSYEDQLTDWNSFFRESSQSPSTP